MADWSRFKIQPNRWEQFKLQTTPTINPADFGVPEPEISPTMGRFGVPTPRFGPRVGSELPAIPAPENKSTLRTAFDAMFNTSTIPINVPAHRVETGLANKIGPYDVPAVTQENPDPIMAMTAPGNILGTISGLNAATRTGSTGIKLLSALQAGMGAEELAQGNIPGGLINIGFGGLGLIPSAKPKPTFDILPPETTVIPGKRRLGTSLPEMKALPPASSPELIPTVGPNPAPNPTRFVSGPAGITEIGKQYTHNVDTALPPMGAARTDGIGGMLDTSLPPAKVGPELAANYGLGPQVAPTTRATFIKQVIEANYQKLIELGHSPQEAFRLAQQAANEAVPGNVQRVAQGTDTLSTLPPTSQARSLPPLATSADFHALASAQRGKPELAMLEVQEAMGGGSLNPLVDKSPGISYAPVYSNTGQNTGLPPMPGVKARPKVITPEVLDPISEIPPSGTQSGTGFIRTITNPNLATKERPSLIKDILRKNQGVIATVRPSKGDWKKQLSAWFNKRMAADYEGEQIRKKFEPLDSPTAISDFQSGKGDFTEL